MAERAQLNLLNAATTPDDFDDSPGSGRIRRHKDRANPEQHTLDDADCSHEQSLDAGEGSTPKSSSGSSRTNQAGSVKRACSKL